MPPAGMNHKKAHWMKRIYSSCLFLAACCPGFLSAAITVDGVLDEPEWAQAQVFEHFVETEPRTGNAAKYRTVARVYSDDSGIYIAFANEQPPEVPRVDRRFPRDAFLEADRNIVGLDFDGNSLSGYDFTVSSSNSIQDGIFTGELSWSADWDGTWYSQTSATENAWYSEIHIPWTVAPMTRPPADGIKTMRIYLSRVVFGESLRFAYPDAATDRTTFLSDWQPIQIRQERSSTLEWFPYLTYSNERVTEESEWKAGLDMVWRPNSSAQITGAINPDFGQVEADDLVVNFSAIEAFFSEKRPFFTENQALFMGAMPNGDQLVHTRRIGAAADAGDEAITDIDLAAKGTVYGQQVDYGAFAVQEDDTRLSEGGQYASTRVQGRVGGAAIGQSFTWADRPTLDRTALVTALDLDWVATDTLRLEGRVMNSRIEQEANEFNGGRDQDDSDVGGYARLRYAPNAQWQHSYMAFYYGDEFDINDLGFLGRNDHQILHGSNRYDVLDYGPESAMRSSQTELFYAYEENTAGDKLLPWIGLFHEITFESTELLSAEVNFQMAGHDDLVSRGNGLVHIPAQQSFDVEYTSRRDKSFGYNLELVVENDGTDAFSTEVEVEGQYYALETLTLGGTASWRDYREWLLWDFDSEQMATFEAQKYEVDLRLDWYPSSRQEVRLKVQWVAVSADALGGFGLSNSGRLLPSDRPVSDFSLSDTAVQLRYRYELAPLSDIFLVYSRGGFWNDKRSEDSAGDLLQYGWDEKHTETILAKIRYRF